MGIDIHGWVEVRQPGRDYWLGAIKVHAIAWGQNHDAWGCLFLGGPPAYFVPLAPPDRGMPPDACFEVREGAEELRTEYPELHLHPYWVSWAEIAAMDRDEEGVQDYLGLMVSTRHPDGTWHREEVEGKPWTEHIEILAQHDSTLASVIRAVADGTYPPDAPREWEFGDTRYRVGRLKRREAFSLAWRTLFELMEVLAGTYGSDAVRLSAWFD
jgi:hypothetical protein